MLPPEVRREMPLVTREDGGSISRIKAVERQANIRKGKGVIVLNKASTHDHIQATTNDCEEISTTSKIRAVAEDRPFATLDPTTRRVQMKNAKEFLFMDTVGFMQKLPTTLVAALRATLEEISESSLLVHVVDISHPLAEQQIDAVDKVLAELDVASIRKMMVWNKIDKASDPLKIKLEAEKEKTEYASVP